MKIKIHLNCEFDVTKFLKLFCVQSYILLLKVISRVYRPILYTCTILLFIVMVGVGRWVWLAKSQPREKYAVLMSAGITYWDDKPIHSEYWYDLVMVYKALIDQGYTHENIYVFYGDGENFSSKYSHYNPVTYYGSSPIVDYANNRKDVTAGFNNLAYRCTSKDKLTIYWLIGHGGIPYFSGRGYDKYQVYFERWDSTRTHMSLASVDKADIFSIINSVDHYKQREIYWLTCYSGSIIMGDLQLSDYRTTVITSSEWDQYSHSSCPGYPWWYYPCHDYISGEFNWELYGIYHKRYFDNTDYVPYNKHLMYPITPYKIYRELSHSKVLSSTVQIGGGSPTAYYIKTISWLGKETKIIRGWVKRETRIAWRWIQDLWRDIIDVHVNLIKGISNVERN